MANSDIPEPEFVERVSLQMDFAQEMMSLPEKMYASCETPEQLAAANAYWRGVDIQCYEIMIEDGKICKPCAERNHTDCPLELDEWICACAEYDHDDPRR